MSNMKKNQTNKYNEANSDNNRDEKSDSESEYAWCQNDDTTDGSISNVNNVPPGRSKPSSHAGLKRPRRSLPIDLPMASPIPLQQEPQLYDAWCAKNRLGPIRQVEYKTYEENRADCESVDDSDALNITRSTILSNDDLHRGYASMPVYRRGVPSRATRQKDRGLATTHRPSLRCLPAKTLRAAGKKSSAHANRSRHNMGDQLAGLSKCSLYEEIGYPVQAHVAYKSSETRVGARHSRRSHGKIVIPLDIFQQPYPPNVRIDTYSLHDSLKAHSRKEDSQSRDGKSQHSSASRRKPRSRQSHVSSNSNSVDNERVKDQSTGQERHPVHQKSNREEVKEPQVPERSSLDDLLTFYENTFGHPLDATMMMGLKNADHDYLDTDPDYQETERYYQESEPDCQETESECQDTETENKEEEPDRDSCASSADNQSPSVQRALKQCASKTSTDQVKVDSSSSESKVKSSLHRMHCLAKNYRKSNVELLIEKPNNSKCNTYSSRADSMPQEKIGKSLSSKVGLENNEIKPRHDDAFTRVEDKNQRKFKLSHRNDVQSLKIDMPQNMEMKSGYGDALKDENVKQRINDPSLQNLQVKSRKSTTSPRNVTVKPNSFDNNMTCVGENPQNSTTNLQNIFTDAGVMNFDSRVFYNKFKTESPNSTSDDDGSNVDRQAENTKSEAFNAADLVDASWAANMLAKQNKQQRVDPRQVPKHLLQPKVPSWLQLKDSDDDIKKALKDMMTMDMQQVLLSQSKSSATNPTVSLDKLSNVGGSSQLVTELEKDNEKELDKLYTDLISQRHVNQSSSVDKERLNSRDCKHSRGNYTMKKISGIGEDPRDFYEQIYIQQHLIDGSENSVAQEANKALQDMYVKELVRKEEETLNLKMQGSEKDVETSGRDACAKLAREREFADLRKFYESSKLKLDRQVPPTQAPDDIRRRPETNKEFVEKRLQDEDTSSRDWKTRPRQCDKPIRLQTVIEESPEESLHRNIFQDIFDGKVGDKVVTASQETSNPEENPRRSDYIRPENLREFRKKHHQKEEALPEKEVPIETRQSKESKRLKTGAKAKTRSESKIREIVQGLVNESRLRGKDQAPIQGTPIENTNIQAEGEENVTRKTIPEDLQSNRESQRPTSQEGQTPGALMSQMKGQKTRSSEVRTIVKARLVNRVQKMADSQDVLQSTVSHNKVVQPSSSQLNVVQSSTSQRSITRPAQIRRNTTRQSMSRHDIPQPSTSRRNVAVRVSTSRRNVVIRPATNNRNNSSKNEAPPCTSRQNLAKPRTSEQNEARSSPSLRNQTEPIVSVKKEVDSFTNLQNDAQINTSLRNVKDKEFSISAESNTWTAEKERLYTEMAHYTQPGSVEKKLALENKENRKSAVSSNIRDNELRELWRHNEENLNDSWKRSTTDEHEIKSSDSFDWVTMSERDSSSRSTTNSQRSSGNNSYTSYRKRSFSRKQPKYETIDSIFDEDLTTNDELKLVLPSESYIERRVDKVFSHHFETESDTTMTGEVTQISTNSTTEVERKKSFIEMSIEQAIDLIKRQASKIEDGLCMEITKSLTDKLIECDCAKEEKKCLQQIQRLRHEHLQHIRREVRHLQNIEGALSEYEQDATMNSPNTIRWKNNPINEE